MFDTNFTTSNTDQIYNDRYIPYNLNKKNFINKDINLGFDNFYDNKIIQYTSSGNDNDNTLMFPNSFFENKLSNIFFRFDIELLFLILFIIYFFIFPFYFHN